MAEGDHAYEERVWLDPHRYLDFGTSYGVCDLSYNQFDDAGNLTAFFYVQTDPEKMVEVASVAAATWTTAESFHAEVVAQLRANQNGSNGEEADGEA